MKSNVYFHGDRKQKKIALTFDDGPHPIYTVQIINFLKQVGVKATFFVNGKFIKENSELLKNLFLEGHQIGNHGYSHKNLIFKSIKFVKKEIENTDRIIEKVCGIKTDIVRPPFLRIDLFSFFAFIKLKKIIVMADISSHDYKSKNAEKLVGNVLKRVKNGSILIFHDGGGERQITIDALRIIIPNLINRGFIFSTISDMIK